MLEQANNWLLLIVAVHVVVAGLLGWLVYRVAEGWARYLGFGILYGWLAATFFITTGGIVEDMTAVVSPLGFAMTTATVSGLWLIFYWPPLKRIVAELPLAWLMGVQVYRVLGIVFLFGWQAGEIPTALGPLTALNDVIVGLTAPLAVWLFVRRRALRVVQAWNIFGLLDFAYAVTVGILAAPHALQLLQLTPDTSALGLLPLSFIVLWAVPLSIMLHALTLARLSALATLPRSPRPHPQTG